MKKMTVKLSATVLLMLANAAWADTSFDTGMRLKQQEKFAEAAAAFRQTLNSEPQNAQAWQQLATVEAWLNHFDLSVAAWRSVLKITPNQASAHVGLARVLYWQGKHADALREVDAGIALETLETPKAEVLVLKGDILLAMGNRTSARASYLQAQALAKGDADIAKKITRTDEPKNWRLDAGYLADQFSAIRGNESSAYVQLGNQISADTSLYLRADRYNSFNNIDSGLSAGGYFRLAPTFLLNAELGFNVDKPNRGCTAPAIKNSLLSTNICFGRKLALSTLKPSSAFSKNVGAKRKYPPALKPLSILLNELYRSARKYKEVSADI